SRSNSAWLSSRSNSAREEIATVSGGSTSDGMAPVCASPVAGCETGSGLELLAEDPFLEVVLGIEQQRHRAVARLLDGDFDHVAHLVRIGGRAHRALVGIE